MAEAEILQADEQVFLIDVNVGDIGDRLFVADIGPVTSDGTVIAYNGQAVGRIDPADNGEDGASLRITFDADADGDAWQAVAAALRFETISDEPLPAQLSATIAQLTAAVEADAVAAAVAQVPVLPSEHPLGDTAGDDILAEGLGAGDLDGGADGARPLFVSEDFRESLESGGYEPVIRGFTPGEGGDVLDLGGVLRRGTYDGGSLEGYVELDDSSGMHTVVRVDIFGTGNFTDLAIIEGATGLGDADSLLNSGNIVV
jgi:hypothetical protein